MPDLDLSTVNGPVATYSLLHSGRPLVLDLGDCAIDIQPWADRVDLVQAEYAGPWELPAIGEVDAPSAILIRPDGYVAWAGSGAADGLHAALNRWFGPPTAMAAGL